MPKTTQLKSTGGIAIVSDIHANIDALGAVLTDLADQLCFSVFCLGDTIGYGPEPAACVKYMREFAPINLMGNHEAMYLATKPKGKKRLDPDELGDLWPPLELCHRQLKTDDAKWISELPLVVPIAEMELVHGSLARTPDLRLHHQQEPGERALRQADHPRQLLRSHPHPRHLAGEGQKDHLPHARRRSDHPGSRLPLRHRRRQRRAAPRRRSRACYVIYHPGSDRVEFRRVPYDIKKAQARFLDAGLSDFDAERIAMGS